MGLFGDGIQYVTGATVIGDLTVNLDEVMVTDSGPGDAASVDIYLSDGGSLVINGNVGDGNNQIVGADTNGIWAETVGSGTITVNGLGGEVIATGNTNGDGNNGIRLNTVDGKITITLDEGDRVTSWTNGLNLATSGTGDIDATNNGTIDVEGHGILAAANGSGAITIANNAMTTIDAGEDGIHAHGNGGDILITNGEGVDPFPDGLIIAGDEGIWAKNENGGNITIYNGMTSNSQSQIYADGDYGIYARSRGDEHDYGDAQVEVWNFGYIETTGYHADAGVYVRTSGDLGGYAAFYNGAELMSATPFNINARVNAYELEIDDNGTPDDPTDDTAYAHHGDANGVELVKMWGDGSGGKYIPAEYDYDWNLIPGTGRTYGVFTKNYGTWDFTGADNYLTPGFDDWGDPVAYGTEAKTTGGIFAPNGSAFLVRNFGDADSGIWNYGTAIGQGSYHDPVIDIETKYEEWSANTPYDSYYGIGNRVFIYNAGYDYKTGTFGLIGSKDTPYAWPISPQEAMEIGFGYFTGGGVDWGFIEGLIEDEALESFAEAASDKLINANWHSYKEGAPVWIYNEGLLIGQVRLNTHGDEYEHNQFDNYGAWFTKGFNGFFGGPYDELWNYGLIQTAFEKYDEEWTGFIRLNEFHNYGVLSMIDGRSGDETKTTGDYYGGGEAYDGSEGLLAVDVRFGPSGDPDDYPNGRSDVFKIGGDIIGSTGVIVHGTNKEPGGIQDPYYDWGIDVVEYWGEVYDNYWNYAQCYGPCKAGDPFYISPLSKNYFESSNGVGLVEDGAFAWYMLHDPYYKEFELFSTWGPGPILSPGVTTGAQTIAHDLFDIIRDHNYGYQFANSGGAGADLAADAPAETSTSSGGSYAGLWAKVSGSWTERDTSITEDLGGGDVTFDTGSSQDIYSVLGGADMKPGGADSPIRLGLFGGYVTSQLDFDLASTSSEYEGGVLGGYAAYNNGAFYVDATVKGELLDTTYSFAGIDVGTDVTNIGVSANTGYKMMMGAGYLEPVASFTYVHTSVDDFSGGGASYDYSNGESLRAGAGARIGTTFGAASGPTTELSLLGKVWNEFEDANEVTVNDGMGNTTTFTDDISGIFGEVSATAMVTSADGTTSGFISAGGQFGEDFTSLNAKAGLRKGF